MKALMAGAVVLMVVLLVSLVLSVPALVLLYGNTICSTTVWIDCLLEHAEAIYNLTFGIVAVSALLMGWWRLRLADQRDSREKEERKEQSKLHERKESDHWRKRFSASVVQVLDDTGTKSLLVARRVHALREMEWIAEKYPTEFKSLAKDVAERLMTSAEAESDLEWMWGGMYPFEAHALNPVSKEDQLILNIKTGGAMSDLYKEAAILREKFGEKPADCGSDNGP